MSNEDSHVFICCDRGDHLAWLEACWFAEQGLDVWCEDGVNPGTPDWQECAQAIQVATHRLFMVTNRFVASTDSVNKLKFALDCSGPSMAVLLEHVDVPRPVQSLVSKCVVLDKVAMSLEEYRDRLGSVLGVALHGAPQVAGRLSDTQSSGYTVGEWRVYPQLLRIECDSESKTLDRKLFDVLALLVKRAPSVVTVEQFLDEVWAGTIVGDNSLHRAISRLRKAFRDDPKDPRYIETIAKSGYRLISTVTFQDKPRAEPLSRTVAAPFYVQLKAFDGIGSDQAHALAVALTTEVQARLADSADFSIMPRADQVSDSQRRPKFVVSGVVQVCGSELRVNLEIDDLVNERVVWNAARDGVCPTSLSEQTEIANELATDLTAALIQTSNYPASRI